MAEHDPETMELVSDGSTPFASVGRFLRTLREAKGLNQLQFAKVSGLSNARISEIESGKNVQLAQIDRYAKGLGYRGVLEMFRAPGDPQLRKLLRLWALLDETERKDALGLIQDWIASRPE